MADSGNDRVQVFHADGTPDFKFGGYGGGDGNLSDPRSVSYSPSGDYIAVADSGNDRVQVFHASNGTLYLKFGSPGAAAADERLHDPRSVSYSPSGDYIAVADSGNDRVQVFYASNGTLDFKFGSPGDGGGGEFDYMQSVAVAPPRAAEPPDALRPGMIVVAEQDGNRIRVFNADGTPAFKFGGIGTGSGQFDQPVSVAVAPSRDRIAVADSGNHRVQVFRSDGAFAFEFRRARHRR